MTGNNLGRTRDGIERVMLPEFKRESESVLSKSHALEVPGASVTVREYLDSMVYAAEQAVPYMDVRRVNTYLCKVMVRISRVFGGHDFGAAAGLPQDPSYLQRANGFASQLVELMRVKDESFNGEGTQISFSTHSSNVADYAARLAGEMGYSTTETEETRIAGKTHDIGKLAVADRILSKPDKLSDAEMEKVKPHPVYGARLVRDAGFARIADIVEVHHRRYDGTGYPEETEVEMQDPKDPAFHILSAADVFDVVSRGRPYRDGLGAKGAMKILEKAAGTQLHPEVVDAAVRTGCLVDEYLRREAA